MKKYLVNQRIFENALHGNRRIPNDNFKENEIIRLFCDNIKYSFPIDVKIRRNYFNYSKTYPAYRTIDFPFLEDNETIKKLEEI